MLKISGLKKNYKSFPVLKHLDMNIQKGDVYGFLGTNGCGKTTTMNIICNVIPKDEGEIAFENEDIKIGYLPESPALYGYMNGFEYLDFIGACSNYKGDIKVRTSEVLEITGMRNDANRLIKGYSRGMNQRIGIAASIYASPDLLILDEPTSALDPAGRAEVMDIIARLSSTGTTIILCTHILNDVERVANKIGILLHGMMAVEGKISDIERMYGTGVSLVVRLSGTETGKIETAKSSLENIEIVDSCTFVQNADIIVTAKPTITEAELFYKTATELASKQIVPEGLWFNRISLEQIYLGINSGQLKPRGVMWS